MRIRNFQAETVSQALRLAKEELGPGAVILKTTSITPEGHLRRTGRKSFQVTACVDDGTLPEQKPRGRTAAASQPVVADGNIGLFNDILSDLRKDVRYLVNLERQVGAGERISREMVPHYIHLIDQEIDPVLAVSIVTEVEKLGLDMSGDTSARKAMLGIIGKQFTDCSEIKMFAGRPARVAIVGPPGSGKSALVAKLAAHLVAEKKAKVTLVSLDDFKPTAANELEKYGKILNVPCHSAGTFPKEVASSDVILIDTAGIPIGAADELDTLRQELSRLDVDETHLVLPAFCRWHDMRRWYEFFRPFGITGTALTFLDQTMTHGAAISLAILEKATYSYFSNGRTSAADLEVANIYKLTEKLIGVSGGIS
jgi:flagellar biosynthesis protein FlhF